MTFDGSPGAMIGGVWSKRRFASRDGRRLYVEATMARRYPAPPMSRRRSFALRSWRVAAAVAVPCLAIACVEVALGADAEERIHLEYRAGAGCPDETSFLSRVGARTQRARWVGESEAGRTFLVQLAAGAQPSGSVTVVDGARPQGTRNVGADTCAEVADALALIVALALDPHALATPVPVSAPGPNEPSSSPAGPEDAGTPAPASSVPRVPSPAVDSSAPPPDAALPSPSSAGEGHSEVRNEAARPGPSTLDLHFLAGVDLAVATGVAPTTLVGGSPYVGWRSTSASVIGPSVRAAVLRIGTGAHAVSGGSADFTWTVGRVDACGLLWPDRALRLGSCARFEAGVLDGTGGGIVNARTQHSPWVTFGALARVEWTFLGSLLLDLEGGPLFRANADRFHFVNPDTTVYRSRSLASTRKPGWARIFCDRRPPPAAILPTPASR
jgi:hypothetical protein